MPKKSLRIVSWNINGIRSVLKKDFKKSVAKLRPDILCLQETRTPGETVETDMHSYKKFWSHAEKKGYSGTAIFSKPNPLKVTEGLGVAAHDKEGRVLTAEYDNFYLVNVYVPNAKRDLSRLDYRCNDWDKMFLKHVRKLDKKKPVIFCGDMNVAHTEDDLANPKSNHKTHGFTPEERAGFNAYIKKGFIDSFRLFTSGNGHYTWWSQLGNCRARNVGWRIDYVCVSERIKEGVKRARIHPDVTGSDHCPASIDFAFF